MKKVLITLLVFGPLSSLAKVEPSVSIFDKPMVFEDESGAKVQLSRWKGEDLVIAFAYTTCRTTCPLVMRQLEKVQKIMDDKSVNGEIIFVTIDPTNDTTSRLARFRDSHKVTSPRWHFLRGSEEDTKALAKELGFGYNFSDEHIWHDRKVMAIGKDGRLRTTLQGWDADLSSLF